MMKKVLFGLSAIAMLFATSCQNDLDSAVNAGKTSEVTFSVSTPDIATRAYSDGKTATVLQYAVYDKNGKELTDLTVTDGTINTTANVKLQLTTGNEYTVLFWAAAENAPYAVDFANKTMTVDYTEAISNDENRDAFYAYYTFTVNGAQTEKVYLKRPFAQLNIGTKDYAASESAGYVPTVSAVTVKDIYSTLDFATGKVSGEAEVVFGENEIARGEVFPIAGYEYIAMNYLLVAAEKAVVDVEFTYIDKAYPAKTRTVGSVPVQRNYRTNIYGQLLTSDVDINIEIVPEYDDEFNVFEVSNAAEFAAAMKLDKENISVVLLNDIEVAISSLGQQTGGSGEYKLGGENTKNISIDLGGKKLAIATTYWSVLGAKNDDALFTIKNGTMTSSQASGTWNSYDLCFANCNYAVENVTFEKAVAFEGAGKEISIKNVTINETHDYYAMWIPAKGQTINIDGLTINSDGRGIKIDEQYVSAPAKVTMNISNAKFNTSKKAAIVVKSVEGAEINVESIDIADVDADDFFAVWVDEDSENYADKVAVNGAYAKVEGSDEKAIESAEDFNAAIAAGAATVYLKSGNFTMPAIQNRDITIAGSKDAVLTISRPNFSGANLNLTGVTVKGSGYSTGIQHVKTVTYNNVKVIGEMCLYGDKATFNNCEFELNNQYIWTYGVKNAEFSNCVFNTNGKAILVYNEGAGGTNVEVTGCTFNATAGAKAGAIANQNCAAIEIDNFQNSGVGAAHNVTASDNTYSADFSGEWRIKNCVDGNAITVNGVQYTQIAIDGKFMTIDSNKNVTVIE